MTTDLLSLLSDLLLDGVLVLLHQLISGCIADVVVALEVFVVRYSLEVLLRGTESIAFVGVLVSEAVGTDDLIHTVVWAVRSYVVLEVDRLAKSCLDERLSHLTILDYGILYSEFLLHEAGDRGGRYVHRGEVLHAVATVDIEYPASWAKAVCRIDITAILLIEFQAPVAFVVLPEGLEVVDVGTLGAEDITEEALLSHVERGELEEVIDAVLEHHAVTLRALSRVDDVPSFLEGRHSWYFTSDVLALLHSIDHHRGVTCPVGSDVDQVNVGAVAELLPCVFATAVSSCFGEACLLEDGLALLDTVGMKVTESLDLYALDLGEALDGTRATHTKPDEADANDGHRSMTESEYISLPSGALRDSGLE